MVPHLPAVTQPAYCVHHLDSLIHDTDAKETGPKVNSDLRPMALVSVVVKTLARIVMGRLNKQTGSLLDPHQFVDRPKRDTADAVYTLVRLTA